MIESLSYGPTTKVVLIGTSTSAKDKKNLPPLPHVVNNIAELIRLFTDPEVIGLDQSTSIVEILDEDEAAAVIDKVLTAAEAATDTFLVYYAGHGLYGDANEPLYLVAKNSTTERKANNAIRISALKQAIANSPAPKRILILDCCYSGRAFEGGMSPEVTAQQTIDIEGTYGVAAVPANHKALAPPGERLTVFTKELVDVLSNGLPNNKSTLTLDDVFTEVRTRLKRKANMPVPDAINWREGGLFQFARNRYQKRKTLDDLDRNLEGIKELIEAKFSEFDKVRKKLEQGREFEISSGATEIVTESQFAWNLTFISIIFAVLISIWVEPLINLFEETANTTSLIKDFFSMNVLRGALIFQILICLWWWYGMFLGRVDPPRSFFKYGLDFLTFGSFAIALRFWAQWNVFPWIIFAASVLMLGRFGLAYYYHRGDPVVSRPLWLILFTLALFMILAVIVSVMAVGLAPDANVFANSSEFAKALEDHVKKVDNYTHLGVIFLLSISIVFTVVAVFLTEGNPLKKGPNRWFQHLERQATGGTEMVADSDGSDKSDGN